MTNQTATAIPTTITEKTAWLEARYWRFGMEIELEDQLVDLFEIDDQWCDDRATAGRSADRRESWPDGVGPLR